MQIAALATVYRNSLYDKLLFLYRQFHFSDFNFRPSSTVSHAEALLVYYKPRKSHCSLTHGATPMNRC